jgi:hypothetical protein
LTPSSSSVVAAVAKPQQQAQLISSNNNSGSPALEPTGIEAGAAGTVAELEPPRALFPTEWKVRPSTAEEREEFRRQERMRYAAPHKAFTYRMHGYASVVGPVKGIYQHNIGKFQSCIVVKINIFFDMLKESDTFNVWSMSRSFIGSNRRFIRRVHSKTFTVPIQRCIVSIKLQDRVKRGITSCWWRIGQIT